MKFISKIIAIVISFACLAGASFAVVNLGYADQEINNQYLIPPTYYTNPYFSDGNGGNINKYNINQALERSATRPFDTETKSMMIGASFALPTDEYNRSEVTYNVEDDIVLQPDSSLYVYMFFSQGIPHNLSLTLGSGAGNITWQVSSTKLGDQLGATASSFNQNGWILIEFPVVSATLNGCDNVSQLGAIQTMYIQYITENIEDNIGGDAAKYFAYCDVYAPYIANSKHSMLSFIWSQPYCVISTNNADITGYCEGDYYLIGTISSVLEYCIIGEMDILQYPSALYNFTMQITPENDESKGKDFVLETVQNGMPRQYQFENAGRYVVRVMVIEQASGSTLAAASMAINVSQFIAVYFADIPNVLSVGETYSYTIYLGDAVKNITNLAVTTSNQSVARAELSSDGYLIIYANQKGSADVTISGTATRVHGSQAETFSKTYTVTVTAPQVTHWWAIILGIIGLIIAAAVAYLIMVKRRLIKGKYPKY